MKNNKKINLFVIFFIFFILIIFLILFIIFIYSYQQKMERFQVQLSDLTKIAEDLEKERQKEDDETQKEFQRYAKINKAELDKYLRPENKKETKVNITNENTDYQKNILKFYDNEKKNEEIVKTKLEELKKNKEKDNLKMKNNNYTFDEYKELMLKNFKSTNGNRNFYKIGLNKIELLKEDCFEKCDSRECIKMNELQKNLDSCLKCNSQKNKCFNKTIIGGTCDDCSDDTKKIDCYNIQNFGCTNPINVDYNRGIDPYFISINDNNVNSPYNKKCVFCWNISNEI